MKYTKFTIDKYRAIENPITIDLSQALIPLIGVNECGKTTILQAIFCFDHINDKSYNGKHLKNTWNLYTTNRDYFPSITAYISCTKKDILEVIDQSIFFYTGQNEKSTVAKDTEKFSAYINSLELFKDTIPHSIKELKITRILSDEPYYMCDDFKQLPVTPQDKFCEYIVSKLPYILYNDDFNDRPVSDINLLEEGEWYDIYDQVFKMTDKNYSIKNLLEIEDERQRDSVLSDAENFLSETLTRTWGTFSPEKKKISVKFNLTIDESDEKKKISILKVSIREKTKDGKNRFFSVEDRSKGFIWYYNFIMKIWFNPKNVSTPKDTIFLLDEPGSYLHESAQSSLCTKLKDISKKQGVVIYCTHSSKLLDPSIIPLNNMLIVDKEKHSITATPLPNKKTTGTQITAMQPVYQALQIPEYETISKDEKILCVEGIYDKYCIECFCGLPTNIRIFACVSADAIFNNIQYFIAYQKQYLALWDNDTEGRKLKDRATKAYGLTESANFDMLPLLGKNKVRMEEMIEDIDYTYLKTKLALPKEATYESILSKLYSLSKKERKNIIEKVSDKTKENFSILVSIINKHLINNTV